MRASEAGITSERPAERRRARTTAVAQRRAQTGTVNAFHEMLAAMSPRSAAFTLRVMPVVATGHPVKACRIEGGTCPPVIHTTFHAT